MKKNKGFTLVEVLVVIGVFGLIAFIGSTIFFSILRGATKTKTLQLVKQNGDYAISVMERMIRGAKRINGSCESSMSSLEIENPDGGITIFRFCSAPDFLIASISGTLTCQQARLTSSDVRLVNGFFDCVPEVVGVKPAIVNINFTLSQGIETSRPEEETSINFKTTVSLRNY